MAYILKHPVCSVIPLGVASLKILNTFPNSLCAKCGPYHANFSISIRHHHINKVTTCHSKIQHLFEHCIWYLLSCRVKSRVHSKLKYIKHLIHLESCNVRTHLLNVRQKVWFAENNCAKPYSLMKKAVCHWFSWHWSFCINLSP